MLTKKNFLQRTLAMLLMLVMIVGMLPLGVFAEGESTPKTCTIKMENAASAKLYAESDTEKTTDLLAEKTMTDKTYSVDLNDGKYVCFAYDKDAKSYGSIVLNVNEDSKDFDVFVITVTCGNDGWVCGTDYTVKFDVRTGGGQATVVREVTKGDDGNTTLCLYADMCTQTAIVPSAAKKAEGFAQAKPEKEWGVTGVGYASNTLTCGKAANFDVTYPYADTDNDGENDYILEVGQMTNYYIYSYFTADSVTEPSENQVTASFSGLAAANYFYRVTNPTNQDAVTYGKYQKLNVGLNLATVTTDNMDVGKDRKSNTVDRSFTNKYDTGDLYVSFGDDCADYKAPAGQLDLKTGDSWTLYPFRNWLAIEGISNAAVIEPDFHVQVVNLDGTPVTVAEQTENNSSKHSYKVTANSAGTAVLLVTYDAMNYPGDMSKTGIYSAIWPENTGVVIVTVDKEGGIATNMTINEEVNKNNKDTKGKTYKLAGDAIDAEMDVLYYYGDEGATYSFKPEEGTDVTMAVGDCSSGAMTFGEFSKTGVSTAEDGTVTLSGLTTGKTIVKLTNGNKVAYQVIRAQKTDIKVTNKTTGKLYYNSADNTKDYSVVFNPGDQVTVEYSVLKHPGNKLSGIYNMTASMVLQGEDGKTVTGTGNQYLFDSTATNHSVTITIPKTWDKGTFSFAGFLQDKGWGSYFGDHRLLTYEKGKTANFNAGQPGAYFGELPGMTLPMAEKLTVKSSADKVERGDTFTVQVECLRAPAFFDLEMTFDDQKAEYVKSEWGFVTPKEDDDPSAVENLQGVKLSMNASSVQTLPIGEDHVLVTLTFKALKDMSKDDFNLIVNEIGIVSDDGKHEQIAFDPTVVVNNIGDIAVYKMGDVNEDNRVSIMDANMIQLYLAKFRTLSNGAKIAADVYQDQEVSVKDVNRIQIYLAHMVEDLVSIPNPAE